MENVRCWSNFREKLRFFSSTPKFRFVLINCNSLAVNFNDISATVIYRLQICFPSLVSLYCVLLVSGELRNSSILSMETPFCSPSRLSVSCFESMSLYVFSDDLVLRRLAIRLIGLASFTGVNP